MINKSKCKAKAMAEKLRGDPTAFVSNSAVNAHRRRAGLQNL